MHSRLPANPIALAPLLDLIEQRFDVRLQGDVEHLRSVREHYGEKRKWLLWEHGEAGALAHRDYAKAFLISEAARLMLREIDPWPRRKQIKKGNS